MAITFVSGRRSKGGAAAFLDGIETLLGGLRRGGGVEVHREGVVVRAFSAPAGVVVTWSASEPKAGLLTTLTDLGREYGFFPQD